MDSGYRDRLVTAYTGVLRRERTTAIDYAEITRRLSRLRRKKMKSQTVGRWLRGEAQPRDPDDRRALAEVLGVTVSWLFYEPNVAPLAEGVEVTNHQTFTRDGDPVPDAPHAQPRKGRNAGEG